MIEKIRDEIEICYGPPMSVISDCIRSFLMAAPKHDLIAADFASIEARVLAWLAGQESILNIFRTHGKIYEHAASSIFNTPVDKITKEQRQIGKVAVLALGYGGGARAFALMGKNYGVHVTDDIADGIKMRWRGANRKIVSYWYDIENAARLAVSSPNSIHKAGASGREVRFKKNGSFLWCMLPSGRALCFPYAKISGSIDKNGVYRENLVYNWVSPTSLKFEEIATYGGKLAENVTQAVARDLLSEAMLRLEKNRYKVVMHVHDEIVCEVPEKFGSVEEMCALMCELPPWAKDLPVKAEGWRGKRFKK